MYIEPASQRTMIDTLRRAGARGPWLLLLGELLHLAAVPAELLHHAERPWSSTTFAGTRHTFRIAFEGAEAVAAGETFIAALPDHEFSVPGRLVADASIRSAEHDLIPAVRLVMEVELLVLDEG